MTDETLNYHQIWYKNNKHKIKDKRNEKFLCDICGGCYTMANKSGHYKSKKHIQTVKITELENTLQDKIKQLEEINKKE